jgi:hypothetical protein
VLFRACFYVILLFAIWPAKYGHTFRLFHQAHLQFAQKPPKNPKLQKSLSFLPPEMKHSETVNRLIIKRLQNINPVPASAHIKCGL